MSMPQDLHFPLSLERQWEAPQIDSFETKRTATSVAVVSPIRPAGCDVRLTQPCISAMKLAMQQHADFGFGDVGRCMAPAVVAVLESNVAHNFPALWPPIADVERSLRLLLGLEVPSSIVFKPSASDFISSSFSSSVGSSPTVFLRSANDLLARAGSYLASHPKVSFCSSTTLANACEAAGLMSLKLSTTSAFQVEYLSQG
eukprot:CAMPEP_0206426368 /NCGR_PEP_ID=MMETSP0324_2-20121206/4334_1 /ASSEMBLY_ACC=CAM_ASM_000836 /TAXON_ID=2866 /ORGANISM="Crypthecodinium cohnii, Strain Seligo" /LENGTH=200 /DNA_ID=CAMNT_0053891305 /DNA_START=401 /DNA_END=1005 /DNA_ORIENTATION=-